MTCILHGVLGIVSLLNLRWLSLAGGTAQQLSSVLHLAREPTVHFPTVDMVAHLLFCWSRYLEFAFSELTLQGRVASYIDRGCLDTLPLWLFCAVYAEPWPGSWFGLLGSSLFYSVLYFDKNGDQAKIVFLSLLAEKEDPLLDQSKL